VAEVYAVAQQSCRTAACLANLWNGTDACRRPSQNVVDGLAIDSEH